MAEEPRKEGAFARQLREAAAFVTTGAFPGGVVIKAGENSWCR